MPLAILVPFVIVGVGLIFLAVTFWGASGIERPLDETNVPERLDKDFPDFKIAKILVSDDAKSAFATSPDSANIALVYAIGQNHLTRVLEPGSIRKLDEQDDDIVIFLNDFTLKFARCRFKDAKTRSDLREKLENLLV